ncbi:uncharacterized protein LOC126812307 isoform X2 [Patella vulgata]|nr:uncharacterized protein LOC126812307 isoform X2 [Patella vulgata]XP_050394616.1 uncharacterized protein LOC126812307 isoform X2 [Patella vulgata]XP_050394634.1 uncharacterized protein LOC126812307 isoform X2 [Patella vulgata]XP_055956559.1 uncharacterized protein LOC126812307 isoform X2 [Patella vulgata]
MLGLRIAGKVTVILIIAVFVIIIGFLSHPGTLLPSYNPVNPSTTWSRFINNNGTVDRLQKKYPMATCPLESQTLVEEDYVVIEACVKGYQALEMQSIDAREMEYKRVHIHKPWLTRNDSVMIEVGGYKGVDAERLISKGMHPKYIALEPVPMFYELLQKKFQSDKQFLILNFGLGRNDRTLTIPIQTDATSLFRQNKISMGTATTNITIRKATTFFDEIKVKDKNVDLLHINCEGCEFELLEDLISTGYIRYFNHVQFQFHMHLPYIEKEACRYCQIMKLLGRTHKPMFQYRHTWQAWEIKTE